MRLFQSGVGNMDLIVKSTHTNTPTHQQPPSHTSMHKPPPCLQLMTQMVNKLTTPTSVINMLVSGHHCPDTNCLFGLNMLENPQKESVINHPRRLDLPICTANGTHTYQTWTKTSKTIMLNPTRNRSF